MRKTRRLLLNSLIEFCSFFNKQIKQYDFEQDTRSLTVLLMSGELLSCRIAAPNEVVVEKVGNDTGEHVVVIFDGKQHHVIGSYLLANAQTKNCLQCVS